MCLDEFFNTIDPFVEISILMDIEEEEAKLRQNQDFVDPDYVVRELKNLERIRSLL